MLTNRNQVMNIRKVNVANNYWMANCCWSCKHSDISYDLKNIVCKILKNTTAPDKICDYFNLNLKNPYIDSLRKESLH